MRIALVQVQMSRSLDENIKRSVNFIEEAAKNKAEIICFPELQLSPFFPQFEKQDASCYLIGLNDLRIKNLFETSARNRVVVIPNFYLKQGEKKYDASPVIDANGKLLGISKMVHIAQCPCFYEQDYYDASDSGFQVYDTAKCKLGIVICFDRHYPEAIRSCALNSASIVFIPTANTKSEPSEIFEWELRIQALHSGVFLAMCNRVGQEGEMDFSGESIVIDPNGEVLAKADDKEQILYVDIDTQLSARVQNERPYLKLRRTEFCTLHESGFDGISPPSKCRL